MRTLVLSAFACLSLGLVACKNAIDIPYSDADKALTVLLVANTTDSEHPMRVSRTDIGRFVPVSEMEADLRVDGQPVPVERLDATSKPGQYRVRYDFKPAQHLALTVKHADKQVYAETTIPDEPNLLSVAVEPYIQTTKWGEDELTKWTIKIQDRAQQPDYYRISILEEVLYTDVATQQLYEPNEGVWLHLDTEADYIISDGAPKAKGGKGISFDLDEIFGRGGKNPLHIFSDRLFDGQGATINPMSDRLPRRPGFSKYQAHVEVAPGRTERKTMKYAYHRYTVYLYALTEDTYRYYQTAARSAGSDNESPFATPIQVHTNVRGGAGILGAYTATTKVIQKVFSVGSGTYRY